MNLKCKLFGHAMTQEMQATDNNPPQTDPEWNFDKAIISVYICNRCCYTFTNRVNFGRKIENQNENRN